MSIRLKNLLLAGAAFLVIVLVAFIGWRWILSREMHSTIIFSPLTASNLFFLILVVFMGVTIALVSIMPLRKILFDVEDLSDDVARINHEGNMAARLYAESAEDELSGLATNINMLLAGAQRASQETLEENVKLRKNITALRTLAEIDREITSKSESGSILRLACRRVPDLLKVPKSVVVLREGPGPIAASFGLTDPGSFAIRRNFFEAVATRGSAYGHGIYVHAGDAVDNLIDPAARQREGIYSALAAQLVVEDQVLGALVVFDTTLRTWSGDELQFMSLLAGQLALALDAARLLENEASRREELSSLYDLSRVLSDANPDSDLILDLITQNAVEKVHVTFARATLRDDGTYRVHSANPIRMVSRDLSEPILSPTSVEFLNSVLSVGGTRIIRREDEGLTDALIHDLMLDMVQLVCLVPMRTEKGTLGMLVLGEERHPEREPFTKEKQRLARNVGDQAVSALRRAELFEELADAYLQTVMALANAVDVKDNYTGDHGRRLAEMAMAIGTQMGMSKRELKDLSNGAILHDIGKIGIPDAILLKPARLDDSEWQTIKNHPLLGEQILAPVASLSGVASIVRNHHERFDGSGYPDGLAGEDIPLGARILTVVDSFCAIIDKRTYKDARSVDEAILELKECSGTQFDPQIARILIDLVEKGEVSPTVGGETGGEDGESRKSAA